MFGIGDQTFDSAKGLEALPNDVTIDIIFASLKITFVKLCKPLKIKKAPSTYGVYTLGATKYLTGVSQVLGPHNRETARPYTLRALKIGLPRY